MSDTIPDKARCAICSHWYSDHDVDAETCASCDRFADGHEFSPRKLAGGTLTPEEERAAYEKAMRENA